MIYHICLFSTHALTLPPQHSRKDSRAINESLRVRSSTHDDPLILPNLLPNISALSPTTPVHPLTADYFPTCWPDVPDHRPTLRPIDEPSDCYDTILLIVEDHQPEELVRWTSRAAWYYGDCGILLEPIASSSEGIATPDVFSRGAITNAALRLLIICVTPRFQYLGGKVKIGEGFFEVQILSGGIRRLAKGMSD